MSLKASPCGDALGHRVRRPRPRLLVEGRCAGVHLARSRAGVDVHGGEELAGVGVQRGELGVDEAGDVLDVVGVVGLEEQHGLWAVVGERLLGEEVGVPRGHDTFDGEEAGVAVVGVQAVALPGVVAEHDRGLELADPVRDLPALAHAGVELAVRPAEEHALPGGAERARPRRAARPGG